MLNIISIKDHSDEEFYFLIFREKQKSFTYLDLRIYHFEINRFLDYSIVLWILLLEINSTSCYYLDNIA